MDQTVQERFYLATKVSLAAELLMPNAMIRATVTLLCILAAVLVPSLALGQQADHQAPPKKSRVPRDLKADQGGGIHFTKHLAVFFGGIKQGSSIAAGPAVSWEFKDGGYFQVKAGYSVKQFKLLQARYDSRPLFGKRSMISTRLRWQDAPKLPLFQEGPDSPDRHLTIGMTKTEWSAFLRTTVAPNVTVSVGSGVEGYKSSGKWADLEEALLKLGAVPEAPGLASRPWYVRSFVSAQNDTRFSPEYTRTGRLLEAGLYHYHDMHDGTESYRRLELAAVQFLPTFRTDDPTANITKPRRYKGALSLFARAWYSYTGTGQDVPFYLMPYLGGGDYLRGYSSYRFHDRNALLLGTEYRYAVHKMLDVAVLVEGGTVASEPMGLSLGRLAPSVAGGVRVHSKTSGLLRLDVARGRDGFKIAIGMSAGS
jgi:hypothetical protein